MGRICRIIERTYFMELNFKLSAFLEKAVQDMGYEKLTEIQEKTIPLILEGKDVIGKSKTGSGKTAAFGIPAVESIDLEINRKNTQVLILCPTRELAIQACGEIRKLTKYASGIKTLAVYGGQPIVRQIPLLNQGCQIVVGTPGRVIDHIKRKTLRLNNVSMVVLDEADEMLNMGFREDIETILQQTPEDRQTILFSATMPRSILNIVDIYQKKPTLIEVESQNQTVDTIKQYYIDCPKGKKVDVMLKILKDNNINLSIIFCNTKRMVDELAELLQDEGIRAKGLHGDMRQRERDHVMNAFRKGQASVLVATDVAARGLDVDNIEAVINYDIPTFSEYYVHRIGRTGRAGKSGLSFSLIQGKRQVIMLRDIMRSTKTTIEEMVLEGFEVPKGHSYESGRDRRDGGSYNRNSRDRNDRNDRNERPYRSANSAGSSAPKFGRDRFEKPKRDFAAPREGNEVKRDRTQEMYAMKISIGRDNNVSPRQIVGAVAGESGISGKEIGAIIINDNHSTVEVPIGQKDSVVKSVNGTQIGGKKITAE